MIFSEALNAVYEQLDCEKSSTVDSMFCELCNLIAEMYTLPPNNIVRINSMEIPVSTVVDIYKKLSSEHLEFVSGNFSKQKHLIKFKKTYLQTALYNSFFEYEAHYTNLVSHDLHRYYTN